MNSTLIAKFLAVVAILSSVEVLSNAHAGTVTAQHSTLEGTIGLPIDLSYEPSFYVISDPTGTFGLGLRPYASLGGTFLDVKVDGSGSLAVNQNPGWNTVSLNASSGTATMNMGLSAGLDLEFIAFGKTITGSLLPDYSPNWAFYDSRPLTSYLLNDSVTLSGEVSQNLVSINTLDALTIWFGIVIPDWLAGINLNIDGVADLSQNIQGAGINTSAGAITSDSQTLAANVGGGTYQLQNVQETWNDNATLSLGLGANMSADLLWGIVSVDLVDFGDVTLISASTVYSVSSGSIPTVQFNLPSYNVLASGGSNGAIGPNGSTSYYTGQSQQFTATPNAGYVVGIWSLDGSPVQSGGVNYTLPHIQNNHTLAVSFFTAPAGPTALTGGASGVGTTSAILNGSVNPNGKSTTAYFEWGTSTSYGHNIPTTPLNAGSGTTKIGVSVDSLTGLIPNTTYHYQLVANNTVGTTYGGDQVFTTTSAGSAPTAFTGSASSIGTISATFNGAVNPNGLSTTWYFEWGTSTSYGYNIPSTPLNAGSGNNSIGVSVQSVSGLNPNSTYHYRLVTVNTAGTTYGGDQTFTTASTGSPPIVTTGAPSGISTTSAAVSGSVNPNGLNTAAYFEWGTNTTYGNTIPNPVFNAGNGNSIVGVSAQLIGLNASITYHYHLVASNAAGTAFGGDQAFTASVLVPTVSTVAADGITAFGAGINGSVYGNSSSTTTWFEWSTDATLSTFTSTTSQSIGIQNATYSSYLSQLVPNRTYYYRVAASNPYGTSRGSIVSFTTLPLAPSSMVIWGDNSEQEWNVPVGLNNTIAIAAPGFTCLALGEDGFVVAWGNNYYNHMFKVPSVLSNVVAIGGGWAHCCALMNNGCVLAWGDNGFGETNVPASLSNVVSLAADYYYTLALRSDGTIVGWGNNDSGQISIPSGLTNVVGIAAGRSHALAIRNDGTVAAWGADYQGQTDVPAGLSNVIAIAAGQNHSIALKGDGTVVAWGANGYGQTSVPAPLSGVVAIAAGGYHNLALKEDGTVVAWGRDVDGQIDVPSGLNNAAAIAAGDEFSMALTNSGPSIIVQQPLNITVRVGGSALLMANAIGKVPLTFQ